MHIDVYLGRLECDGEGVDQRLRVAQPQTRQEVVQQRPHLMESSYSETGDKRGQRERFTTYIHVNRVDRAEERVNT